MLHSCIDYVPSENTERFHSIFHFSAAVCLWGQILNFEFRSTIWDRIRLPTHDGNHGKHQTVEKRWPYFMCASRLPSYDLRYFRVSRRLAICWTSLLPGSAILSMCPTEVVVAATSWESGFRLPTNPWVE